MLFWKVLFGTRRRGEESLKVESQIGESPQGSGTAVIFVGPSYDIVTNMLCGWLKEVAGEYPANATYLFGKNANSTALANAIQVYNSKQTTLVFFGHGEFSVLLTEAGLGYQAHPQDPTQSFLCGADHLNHRKAFSVAGFCCRAAAVMGREFRSQHERRYFLGYRDVINFLYEQPIYQDGFRKPIQGGLRQILDSGEVSRMSLVTLHNLYVDEFNEWEHGPNAQHEKAFLMTMFLLGHLDALDKAI